MFPSFILLDDMWRQEGRHVCFQSTQQQQQQHQQQQWVYAVLLPMNTQPAVVTGVVTVAGQMLVPSSGIWRADGPRCERAGVWRAGGQ